MTYEELLKKFISVCPVYVYDYRPFGRMSLIIWTDSASPIRVCYDDKKDIFTVQKTSEEEWASEMGIN